MNYRRLGKSGLQISAFSFGSWVTFKNQLDQKKARELMAFAYDQGVNFFDNAEVYGNGDAEKLMGNVIRELAWTRDSYCISSKVFWGGEKPTQKGLSRKHVIDACHAALQRFQTDYLDLYYCHRPDPNTPIEETVQAMNDLIVQGKVLYWGTSEWTAPQLTQAYRIANERFLIAPTMEQPQYNMFHREKMEKELLPLFEAFSLGTTTYSPLASGLLTGKYNDAMPEGTRLSLPAFAHLKASLQTPDGMQKLEKARQLSDFAKKMDTTLSKLALAWCLKNPNVSSVILGASSMEQLKENLEAWPVVAQLTDESMSQIDTILSS